MKVAAIILASTLSLGVAQSCGLTPEEEAICRMRCACDPLPPSGCAGIPPRAEPCACSVSPAPALNLDAGVRD